MLRMMLNTVKRCSISEAQIFRSKTKKRAVGRMEPMAEEINIEEDGNNIDALPELFEEVQDIEVENESYENNCRVFFTHLNDVRYCQVVHGINGHIAINNFLGGRPRRLSFQGWYVAFNEERGMYSTLIDTQTMKATVFNHFERNIQVNMDDPLREIALMYHFMDLVDSVNPDLPQIQDHFSIENRVYIVEPFEESRKPLIGYLLDNQLSFESTMNIFKRLLLTVNKLHTVAYAHRNLNLENIYYSVETNTVAIDEFEFVCQVTEHKYHLRLMGINPIHAAPEISQASIQYQHINDHIASDARAADIWSLGIILFELLTHRGPWQSATIHDIQYFLIQSRSLREYIELCLPDIILPNYLIKLLGNMLQIDPNNRWSIAQVIDFVNDHVP
jgi:serine/threonine protein kinase